MARQQLLTTGQRIRFMRKVRELSQHALARKLHVSQPAVSQWEHDKVFPTPQMQRLLSEELGATRTWLFGEDRDGNLGSLPEALAR